MFHINMKKDWFVHSPPPLYHPLFGLSVLCSCLHCWGGGEGGGWRSLNSLHFPSLSLDGSIYLFLFSHWLSKKVSNAEVIFPHCMENPIYGFLFWELHGLSPSFHIHVCVSDLYISRKDCSTYIFPCSRIVRLILEILYVNLSQYMSVGTWRQNIIILYF